LFKFKKKFYFSKSTQALKYAKSKIQK